MALVIPTISATKNVICYYGTWATYRNGAGRFSVDNIDPFLCTHLIYSFVGINSNGTIAVLDPWLDLEENWGLGTMRKFNDLKSVNTNLKTLVAVGGWNEGSQKFSTVAQSATLRSRFAKDAAAFCTKHGFDGLDVDWEYPGQRDGDPVYDRENFVYFLADLRLELSKQGLLLTAAVAATETSALISYNIPEISKYLDFINLMTYDLHGPWEAATGHNAPLYAGPNDITSIQQQLNVKSSVVFWLKQGAPAGKLNLGVPFYGRSFTLRSTSEHNVGAPTNGPGQGGPYSYESGFLGYNEVCEKLLLEKWNYAWDDSQLVPYAYSGNQWVGYDDPESIMIKTSFIHQYELAGGMVWSIETDDFKGKCGEKFVLLTTLKNGLDTSSPTVPTTSTASSTSSVTTTEQASSISTPEGANTEGTSTTTLQTTTSSNTPEETNPTTHHTSTTTPKPTTTQDSGSFKCVDTGYFRDPVNCSKFYYCLRNERYDFECPKGLYFDQKILACNWESSVEC